MQYFPDDIRYYFDYKDKADDWREDDIEEDNEDCEDYSNS